MEIVSTAMLYNMTLALVAFVLYRVMLRLFNRLNGYTIPAFVRECRESKDYYPIAVVFAAQSVSAALLLGLVIS